MVLPCGCACRLAILLMKLFYFCFSGRNSLPNHPSLFIGRRSLLLHVTVRLCWSFWLIVYSHFKKNLPSHLKKPCHGTQAILLGMDNLTTNSGNFTRYAVALTWLVHLFGIFLLNLGSEKRLKEIFWISHLMAVNIKSSSLSKPWFNYKVTS